MVECLYPQPEIDDDGEDDWGGKEGRSYLEELG